MKKLDYIDGLKGIGALMVFFCHFVFAFYYAAYSLTGDAVNTNSGIEITIGKTPLNLLYSGLLISGVQRLCALPVLFSHKG